MNKMITCLWFDRGEAREAAEFYASVFPDSHVGKAHASAVDIPSAKVGEDLTVEFTVLGQAYIGLNGGPNFKPNEAVSFMVLTDNQEETDRYWDAIVGNGGEESACGWCKDRWGFSWQITPRVLLEATTDPDRAAAKRAMEAMMTMRKIDIATIEAARRGEGGDEDHRLSHSVLHMRLSAECTGQSLASVLHAARTSDGRLARLIAAI